MALSGFEKIGTKGESGAVKTSKDLLNRKKGLFWKITLGITVSIGTALFVTTLVLAKLNFNPADWIPSYVAKGRLHFLQNWNIELFSCPGAQMDPAKCDSVSGAFAFQDVKLPLDSSVQLRLTAMAERSTHVQWRAKIEPELAEWLQHRRTEEYLHPVLLLIRNGRCFEAQGESFCSSKTEYFDVYDIFKRDNHIQIQSTVSGMVKLGPQIVPPMLIESNLIDTFIALESKISAAFWSEFILLTSMTFLLGLIALLFPWHAPTVALLGLALTRSLLTVISYGVENQSWEPLLGLLGAHGYFIVSLILNSMILGLLFYLCFAFMRNSFRPSRFEVFYGLAFLLLFFGVALSYGHLGALANASLFARDTIATLFGSIWIMYFLIHEWQTTPEHTSSTRSSLATFVFLFFFVAYGAASAQTALRQSPLPDLLPWQSLFFIPGMTLASFLHLKDQLNKENRSRATQPQSGT